jgi:Domain of unknown function (DUF4936)
LSGVELYVYYRVAPADEALACAQVQALQQRLGAELPGLQARLLRRGADASSASAGSTGLSTWMETYRHADGLGAAQLALIRQAAQGVPGRCVGARHEECFEPVGRAWTDGATAPEC